MISFQFIFLFLIFCKLSLSQETCLIETNCNDCLPEHLPTVISHVAQANRITTQHGDEILFHCHNSQLSAFPNENFIKAVCDNGNFKIQGNYVSLSDIGCHADFFEDVIHPVRYCDLEMQGRSIQYKDSVSSSVKHLVEICYDPGQGRVIFARMTFSNQNDIIHSEHEDQNNRINILLGFNSMMEGTNKLDSEKVYFDDNAMNKKMTLLLGRNAFNLAHQTLIATELLPNKYFYNQNGRASRFSHNKVAVWKSIANGNLINIQNDVFDAFNQHTKNTSKDVDIYVGTFRTLTLPSGDKPREIYLKPGQKYPVPKYIYTVAHDKTQNKAIAIVIINNPFIAISELRSTVFCPSVCQHISWLQNTKFNNNYERPTYGIVFCCDLHSFSNIVGESPKIATSVHVGERGLLKNA